MDRSDFNRWIRRQLIPSSEDAEKAKRFSLSAVTTGKRVGDQLLSVKVPRKVTDDWILDFVNEVERTSKNDAAGMSVAMQSYVVHAYSEVEKEAKPSGRWIFREVCAGEEEGDGAELGNEPPTKQGLVAQQMRHNERIMATAMTMMTQATSYYQRTNTRLAETVEKLIEDKLQTVDLVEDLKSKQFEREREAAKEEQEAEQKRQFFETAKSLLPLVVAKIAGGQVPMLPGHKSPKEMMLDSFLGSLRPDQLPALQATLSQEQMVMVLSIIQEKQKEENAAPVATDANGAVDVN